MQTITTRLRRQLVAVIGFTVLGISAQAGAANYYVDQRNPSASDSNPGTESQPWKTLYRAAEGPLRPGDTVFVKAGTYDVSTGGIWNKPAINPSASGTASAPITFKSLPTHAAILDTKNTRGNPAIGVAGRSHIVIDGFVIPNPGDRGIAIFGPATGIVVQNNIIHGVSLQGLDNTEAVRVERASNVLIRNNKFYNVHNSGRSSNASAVKTYDTQDVTIENNVMYDMVAGVKEKYRSKNLIVRNNHMYNCDYGLVLNTQVDGVTENVHYYQNVVQCRSGFESETQRSTTLRNVHIYNNTFAGYSSKAVHGTPHGQSMYIYNNIFYRTGGISMADFFTNQTNTSEIKVMDYNLFSREPKVVIGLYSTNQTFNSLSAWKSSGYGLSANDFVLDGSAPLFVNATNGDFRLAAGSPAIGAGRVNGNRSGAPVNLGAYANDRVVVGIDSGAASAPVVAPPSPPRLLQAN